MQVFTKEDSAECLNQVYRTSCVRLAECVKSLTDYWMTFVYEQANNRSEKGSLIHLTTNFQKQVQVTDMKKENETETNTAPMTAKKRKGKRQK